MMTHRRIQILGRKPARFVAAIPTPTRSAATSAFRASRPRRSTRHPPSALLHAEVILVCRRRSLAR